jgi:hypothetical protein
MAAAAGADGIERESSQPRIKKIISREVASVEQLHGADLHIARSIL